MSKKAKKSNDDSSSGAGVVEVIEKQEWGFLAHSSSSSSGGGVSSLSSSSSSLSWSYNRACDHKACIVCRKQITTKDEGCVVTVPSKRLTKLAQKTLDGLHMKWNKQNVVDYLHSKCWDAVYSKREEYSTTERLIFQDIEDTVEKLCCEEDLVRQVKEVVQLMLQSKQTVCFTGAGISASAGLSTYRGTDGIDTLAALSSKRNVAEIDEQATAELEGDEYSRLIPTFTHTSLAKLNEMGKMDYCITQNCDNLHVKGGMPRECVSDLHGNVFVEYCEKCLTQFYREYAVDAFSTDCYNEPYFKECAKCGFNHYTGRICDAKTSCKGKLRDTIVNFSDDLHPLLCGGLWKASRKARHADLCITLGTSLTVSPANYLPTHAKQLVIVNLQATDLDEEASIRIYAKTDDFFQLLMPELERELSKLPEKKAGGSKTKPLLKKEVIILEDEDDEE